MHRMLGLILCRVLLLVRRARLAEPVALPNHRFQQGRGGGDVGLQAAYEGLRGGRPGEHLEARAEAELLPEHLHKALGEGGRHGPADAELRHDDLRVGTSPE